jgi:ATP-binding cassette subfamily B protein
MRTAMRQQRRSRFKQVVINHLLQVKASLLLAALCMLGFTLTGLLAPWPLKIIFDYVLLDERLPSSLSFLGDVVQRGKFPALALISLAIVLIALLKGLFSYAQLYITSRVGYQMVYALRRQLFVHLQRLSLSFHNRARFGELLSKLTGDTNNLKDVFAESALTVTGYLLTLFGMFAVMFAMNWRLSLIVLATFPVLFYALSYLHRKIKASAKRQRRSEGRITSRISEILTAVSVVQAFGRERYEEERFETESGQTLEESIRTTRMEASSTRIVEMITAIGTWAVILLGSLQVLDGRMTPGDILIFVSYVTSLYKPIRGLARLSVKASKAMVSAERIAEILEKEPEIQDNAQAVEASGLKGEIIFEDVSFDYGNGKSVLNDVSFTISPGQTVALVGPSGAGKSTIANLLLRFYDPHQGRILIDGTDIRQYKLASLREQIAVVLQESVLFCTTIKENIAYGKLDATMEEIIAATKAARAHDFILELEQGYDTIIGERGDTLSGGQRQRIAIARALIRNAPILILDEPMRGLDVESEMAVREALKRLMAGKTCLLITHDLQAVAGADLVLVLQEGRIVERGGHSDLIARSRQYRQLYELKIGQNPSRTISMEEA